MKKFITSSMPYCISSILFYLVALLEFVYERNNSLGFVFLSLGSVSLYLCFKHDEKKTSAIRLLKIKRINNFQFRTDASGIFP